MTAVTNEFRTESSVGTERLRELLEPRSIVIIGANSKSTWSHFAHSNLLAAGFTGELYLVNRRAEECHGQASYASIAELPEAPELAIVLTGTNSLPQIQEQCIAKGIRNLIVLASGLGEAGEEGQALQQQLVDRAREADQLILGPNNLGFINFHSKVAAFAHMTQLPLVAGGVGIASQSGALTIYLLPYMASRGVGASLCVTVGNEAMISAIDVMSLLVEDEDTKVIAAYLEQVTDTAQFLDVARRAREAGKPIVVFKAGASEASAKAAAAHTGSLAGDDKIFDAVCRQFGVIRVANIEDLVATAGILESYGALPGPRFGVVTASGAMCALVADKAEASGLQLPSPAEATVRQLREDGLPEFAAVNNPMDTTGYISVDPSILTKAGDAFINDENFDFVVLNTSWPTNQFMADLGKPTQEGLHRQLTASAKPVVAMSFLPTEVNEFARNFAAEHSLPHASDSFDRGIEAAGHSVWWGQRTAQLAAEPQLGAPARIAKLEGAEGWTEIETGDFLREHGVPYVPGRVVASAAQAVATAQEIGYPVVLKVASEDIAHKTEVGGVRLMLKDAAEVSEAHEFIVDSVAKLAPEARVQGVAVSPMRPAGNELLVGIITDPQWGKVLAVGFGGVLVEILKDSALRLLPVSPQEIRRMLDSLRGIDLLTGFRGSEATDLDELAQVIFQITQVALGLGEDLEELEINPLRVAGNQIEALDALIRWKDR
ncbi:acetate--CoA ligase family protein [Glutamicibacter protophormiae]|uniref:acetate--CoA ligase family protein n=1 Tax=Glutamicibacter protophormiae TaxID=37930 RepID=UPI00195783C5|nr:acetate--CoA ligase family protein [Glutamicibacter protophormiae]QRQ78286.1 acetate--CoA ligase family protein [Glutamicibacter protophormiae]